MLRAITVAALLFPVSVVAQDGQKYQVLETQKETCNFSPGGQVRLRTGSGEVRITPGADDRVVVRHTLKSDNPEFREKVRITLNCAPSTNDAEILVSFPQGRGDVDLDIAIPSESALHVRMTAGVLDIGAFNGDQDMELKAGNMRVKLPRASAFHSVEASVGLGELSAAKDDSLLPFGRKLVRQGSGRHVLQFRVEVGNLELH